MIFIVKSILLSNSFVNIGKLSNVKEPNAAAFSHCNCCKLTLDKSSVLRDNIGEDGRIFPTE